MRESVGTAFLETGAVPEIVCYVVIHSDIVQEVDYGVRHGKVRKARESRVRVLVQEGLVV